MDLIDKLHAQSPLYLTREQFAQTLEGWDIEPVEQGGAVIGCFVVKGPEVHYAKFDDTPVSKRHLKRIAALIDQYGYAQTATPKDDARQVRFNQRLNGRIIGETEHDFIFRFERRH